MMLSLAAVAALAALGLVATWTDLTDGRVPDWLTLGALAAFLGFAAWQGSLVTALLGALLPSAILLLCRRLGVGVRGGDVKYLAAVGALLGPALGLLALLTAAVVALVVGVIARWRGPGAYPFAPALAVSSLLALNLDPTWTWIWHVGRWGP